MLKKLMKVLSTQGNVYHFDPDKPLTLKEINSLLAAYFKSKCATQREYDNFPDDVKKFFKKSIN